MEEYARVSPRLPASSTRDPSDSFHPWLQVTASHGPLLGIVFLSGFPLTLVSVRRLALCSKQHIISLGLSSYSFVKSLY